ncbi:zinc finger domain-containing protein [Actinocorallia herbida]|nr:hypothetical protein [Actinocorallia herbida]
MGKTKARLLAKWAEREAEYQRMLGLETSEDRPVEEVVTVRAAEVAEAVEAVIEAPPPKPARRTRERRPAPQPTDVKPYQVGCPRCAAQPGNPCRTGAGKPVRPHTDRLRQAAEAARTAPVDQAPPAVEPGASPLSHFFETARETPATGG